MRLVQHGGQCCGYYHIFGMGTAPDRMADIIDFMGNEQSARDRTARDRTNVDVLDELLSRFDRYYAEIGDNREGSERILEVILTEPQTRTWNASLVERGFFPAVRWRNANTGNLLTQYLRHTGDIRLVPAGDISREVVLPPLNRAQAQAAPVAPEPVAAAPVGRNERQGRNCVNDERLPAGTRVIRIDAGGGSVGFPVGSTGTVTDQNDGGYLTAVQWDTDAFGQEPGRLYTRRFALLEPIPAEPEPEPVIAQPANQAVILTEYFAHLRDHGRRGSFASLLEASQAYPRCRQFDRRVIMSDGTVNWEEGVAA